MAFSSRKVESESKEIHINIRDRSDKTFSCSMCDNKFNCLLYEILSVSVLANIYLFTKNFLNYKKGMVLRLLVAPIVIIKI